MYINRKIKTKKMIKNILGIAALTAMMMSCNSKGNYSCDCTTTSTYTYSNGGFESSTTTSVNTGKTTAIFTEVSKLTAEKQCSNIEQSRKDVNSETGVEKPGQTPTPSKRTCTITSK